MQTSWDGCLGHDRRARVCFSLQWGFGLIAEESAYVAGSVEVVRRLQWGLGLIAEEFVVGSRVKAQRGRLQWGLGLIAEELPEVTGSIFG